MKYKLKIIPKFLLFVAFLTLTNCSKDAFDEQIKNSKDKNDISFEQFKKETGLTDFKTTISINLNNNTSSARNADGSYELTDFEIDIDLIKRIELNSKVTYTFATKPIVDASIGSIYNLIIHNKNGVWESTIVEYIPTEQSYEELIHGTAKTFKGTMKLLFETYTSITSCTEITVVTYHCHYSPCSGTNGSCDAREGYYCPECADYQTVTLCTTDEYGNSTGAADVSVPVDSGSYGGGAHINAVPTSSAPTAITESVLTTPNLEGLNLDFEDQTTEPCKELNKLNKKTELQNVLRALKTQAAGSDSEHGNYIKDQTDAAGNVNQIYPIIPPNPSNPHILSIIPGLDGSVRGLLHHHTDPGFSQGGVPMFGQEDLTCLFIIARRHHGAHPETAFTEYTVMVTVGTAHYALKLKNYNDYNLTFNNRMAQFQKKIDYAYGLSGINATPTTLVKDFLTTLKECGFNNVGLYKATETSENGIDTITGWNEQILNQYGDVIEVPCNN